MNWKTYFICIKGYTFFKTIINIKCFRWQRKFQVVSGACVGCAALSLAFKPLKPVQVVTAEPTQSPNRPLTVLGSMTSFSFSDLSKDEKKSLYREYHNTNYPTNLDVHGKKPMIVNNSKPSTSTATRSRPITVRSAKSTRSNKSIKSKKQQSATSQYDKLSVIIEDNYNYNCFHLLMLKIKMKICCCLMNEQIPQRPMYRDDALYIGSLKNLPAYKSRADKKDKKDDTKSILDYHMAVTRVTTQDDVEESLIPCVLCPESVKRVLATMFDPSLLVSPGLLLLNFSALLTVMGFYIPFVFFKDNAIKNGMSKETAFYLLPVLGLFNVIGRIITGLLTAVPQIKATPVSIAGLSLAGLAILVSPFWHNMYFQFAMIATFGLCVSVISTLRPVMILEIVGLGNLTNAFGIYMVFVGLAALVGTPVAGALTAATGRNEVALWWAGGIIILSAILLIPVKYVDIKFKKKLGIIT